MRRHSSRSLNMKASALWQLVWRLTAQPPSLSPSIPDFFSKRSGLLCISTDDSIIGPDHKVTRHLRAVCHGRLVTISPPMYLPVRCLPISRERAPSCFLHVYSSGQNKQAFAIFSCIQLVILSIVPTWNMSFQNTQRHVMVARRRPAQSLRIPPLLSLGPAQRFNQRMAPFMRLVSVKGKTRQKGVVF
jgi:hypothetical protein